MCQYHVSTFCYIDHSILNQNRNTDLEESKARTSMEGTMLKTKAFSRNFHIIGTLFSQQICETKTSASSIDGRETPAEAKFDETSIDQRRGSLPFSWASLVCIITTSQRLLGSGSAISRSQWSVFGVVSGDREIFRVVENQKNVEGLSFGFAPHSATLRDVHVCVFWSWNWSGQTWRKSNWL